jgi:hypothetical protein
MDRVVDICKVSVRVKGYIRSLWGEVETHSQQIDRATAGQKISSSPVWLPPSPLWRDR